MKKKIHFQRIFRLSDEKSQSTNEMPPYGSHHPKNLENLKLIYPQLGSITDLQSSQDDHSAKFTERMLKVYTINEQLTHCRLQARLFPYNLSSVTSTSNTRCHSVTATTLHIQTKQATENSQYSKYLYNAILNLY